MNDALSFLVSFGVCTIANFLLLGLLRNRKVGQEILQYVTEHSAKQGTPTMGGLGFIFTILLLSVLFCDWSVRCTAVAVAVFVAYGIVGFLDDYIKVCYKQNLGLKAYQKIAVQLVIAVLVSLFVYGEAGIGDKIVLPFVDKQVSIGWGVVPLTIFVYLACTNGVNLTDGLDGLATSTTICFFVGMVFLLGRQKTFLINLGDTVALAQVSQMSTLCCLACGALSSFLLFNAYQAKMFMGDTGSLALGALVACVAIFTRMTLFIPVVGVMFVASCISVIVQVGYFKLSGGKRVFLMAPYHHHLQKKGWSETRICVLYSVVTMIFVMIILTF